ncbi:hypothetical protein ACFV4P_33985 [Kitasatospora sp. NPDC059795]|uniref:hypothetical protein n=1 Tax=Kitasatospora sp. NPDC059795 TaxID=3346949 RepID=UPI003656BF75
MLLYAFQDEHGRWHGDPDTETLDGHPGTGTLRHQPRPGDSTAFARQRLHVLYGPCMLDPSAVEVQLEDGMRLALTWRVLELLEGGPDPLPPAPRDAGARNRTPARSRTLPAVPPPRTPGAVPGRPRPWTPEEDAYCHAAAGAAPEAIAAHLGRSAKSVRFRLAKLHLEPFPLELLPPPAIRRGKPAIDPNSHRAQVMRDHPRAYLPWTPEEEEAIAEMARSGADIGEIAAALQRQPGAVSGRMSRLTDSNPVTEALWIPPPWDDDDDEGLGT